MPLTKSMSKEKVIKDFVHSDNKMFSGDSKKKRIQRAVAAYYRKQRNEDTITERIIKQGYDMGDPVNFTKDGKSRSGRVTRVWQKPGHEKHYKVHSQGRVFTVAHHETSRITEDIINEISLKLKNRYLKKSRLSGHKIDKEFRGAVKGLDKNNDTTKALWHKMGNRIRGQVRATGGSFKEEVMDEGLVSGIKKAVKAVKNDPFAPWNKNKVIRKEDLDEGRRAVPLGKDHPYHSKSDAELLYIARDAGHAAKAAKGLSSYNPHTNKREDTEGKYLDQMNDAHTVLHYRRTGGKIHPKKVDESLVDGLKKAGSVVAKGIGLALGGPPKKKKDNKKPFKAVGGVSGYSGETGWRSEETLIENADKIKSWMAGAQKIIDTHHSKHFPSLPRKELSASTGKKYTRITHEGSAFAFIDNTTGDVLKPASWKVPAKHARGNINDEHGGLKHVGPYGPAYLKKGGGGLGEELIDEKIKVHSKVTGKTLGYLRKGHGGFEAKIKGSSTWSLPISGKHRAKRLVRGELGEKEYILDFDNALDEAKKKAVSWNPPEVQAKAAKFKKEQKQFASAKREIKRLKARGEDTFNKGRPLNEIVGHRGEFIMPRYRIYKHGDDHFEVHKAGMDLHGYKHHKTVNSAKEANDEIDADSKREVESYNRVMKG